MDIGNSKTGMLLMTAAAASFTLMNVLVKLIGPEFHAIQISFIRNLIAAFVLLPLLLYSGGVKVLKTQRFGTHFWRGFLGVTGNILYFFSFQMLSVGYVSVISQAVPVFVAVMAVFFLNERVGHRRWLAIIIGFIGVIIAINPSGTIEIASLIAVLATVLWAATILLVRSLAITDNPFTIAFYFMVIGTILAGALQPWYWQEIPLNRLWLFIGVGLAGASGQLLMSYALKFAEASIVSPFNYTAILWAIIFDAIIWGFLPTWTTIVGATIITSAGIYIFRREAIIKGKEKHIA
ncbi:MAG: DMT family transporter [Pseudomonadota bacterium]|nr:DMT family transporter [Pseudomonadota bacterium]